MDRCIIISGRVQGVGFRFWTVRQARAIGNISGYVRNLEDGNVAVYMSASQDKINQMQAVLYKGPLFARVDAIREAPEQKIFFPPIENGVFKRI